MDIFPWNDTFWMYYVHNKMKTKTNKLASYRLEVWLVAHKHEHITNQTYFLIESLQQL